MAIVALCVDPNHLRGHLVEFLIVGSQMHNKKNIKKYKQKKKGKLIV